MRKNENSISRRLKSRLAIALAMSFCFVSAFGTFAYAAELPGSEEVTAENSVVLHENAKAASIEAEYTFPWTTGFWRRAANMTASLSSLKMFLYILRT